MTSELKPVAEILVPIDFSPCAQHALQFALRVAAAHDSRIHLLYVDDDPLLIQKTTAQKFRDEHADKMSLKFVDVMSHEDRERFNVEISIRFGTAYHEIEEYAREKGIELIVMGNIGRSAIVDVLLGSVTSHVVRHACCPVLTVKD